MTYYYVLTLHIPDHDPVTYKGTCDLSPGATASALLDFATDRLLTAVGRPEQKQYAVLFWQAGPRVLVPEVEEARR